MSIHVPSQPIVLSDEQRQRYHDDGFLGPLKLCSPEQMQEIAWAVLDVMERPGLAPAPSEVNQRGRIAGLLSSEGKSSVPYCESRHLDSELVLALCSAQAIVSCVTQIYGPDIVVWRSTLIQKVEGSPEFRWHQDYGGVFGRGESYGLEPPVHFTAWVALTEATRENGCMEFIPGVRNVLPTVPASPDPRATLLVPDEYVDTSRAVPMELAPGEFVLFTDRALHASGANLAGQRRLALSIRMTLPFVRVRPHFADHRVVSIAGRRPEQLARPLYGD